MKSSHIIIMVKVALIGAGHVGGEVIKALHQRQAQIVAVFTRSSNVGQDVGEVFKIGPIGVKIQPVSGAKEILSVLKPDICLIQTQGDLSTSESCYVMCAELGINVLTLTEEAFYPNWETSTLAEQLDKVFTENNCTFSGSGFQDFVCSNVLSLLTSVYEVKKITISTIADANHYYSSLSTENAKSALNTFGIGLSMEEFRTVMQDQEAAGDGMMGNVIRWLCAYLGLEIKEFKAIPNKPVTSARDIYVKVIDEVIHSGKVTGIEEQITADTVQGVQFELKSGCHTSEECGSFFHIDLDSNLSMSLKFTENYIAFLTVVPYVNRILDVIQAPSGYVTTDKLPLLHTVNSFK